MSTRKPTEEDILRPIERTTPWWFAFALAASIALGIFLILWAYQLWEGLVVTGLSDWGTGGGVTWGLYIGAFIWWVGIAHGGIILSAAVRLLGMKRYMPVARLAELLTIGGLSAAGFYILIHMGRPDRMVTSVIGHYHITVHNSPLVWDVTVITAYFVLTATYLGLTLRYDISQMRDSLPTHAAVVPESPLTSLRRGSAQVTAPVRRYSPVNLTGFLMGPVSAIGRPFTPVRKWSGRYLPVMFPLYIIYDLMTLGYTKEEDEVIERMVWWVAAAIIIMAPLLLHGGVIPWLFALLPTYPGWFGAVQGPQFLTIALTSAISGVIIISYAFRRSYDWYHIIGDDVFRGLLLWLGFFSLLFLWLQLQQVVSGVFSPPIDQAAATDAKVSHPIYVGSLAMVAATLIYIFAQAVRPELFSINAALTAAVAVLTATLLEKIFFVVEGLMYPTFSIYEATPGTYWPSLVEMSSVLGTIGLVTMMFLVVAKVFPVVELHAVEYQRGDHGHGHGEDEQEEVHA